MESELIHIEGSVPGVLWAPPPDCFSVGGGWWQKTDPSSGRPFFVHEQTGACQWDNPATQPAAP